MKHVFNLLTGKFLGKSAKILQGNSIKFNYYPTAAAAVAAVTLFSMSAFCQ